MVKNIKLRLKNCIISTFSASLQKYGFIYIKKYNMFMRVVKGTFLQYIACVNIKSTEREMGRFIISAGILSIYTYAYDKDILLCLAGFIDEYEKEYFQVETTGKQRYFYNEDTMLERVNQALEDTIKVILPVFDQVIDLDTYINYRMKIRNDSIILPEEFKTIKNDSLVLIKANNHDDFIWFYQEILNRVKLHLQSRSQMDLYEHDSELIYNNYINNVPKSRDKVYNDPELYSQAMTELERREKNNLETLKQLGLI